jgi:hypothetical protein
MALFVAPNIVTSQLPTIVEALLAASVPKLGATAQGGRSQSPPPPNTTISANAISHPGWQC